MKKYYHQKLIRDKISEIIKSSGSDFKTTILNDSQYEKALKNKLVEEAKELEKAPPKDLLNELADVFELIKTIASHHHIKFQEVENYQKEKRKKRGGFTKKLFLIWSGRSNL